VLLITLSVSVTIALVATIIFIRIWQKKHPKSEEHKVTQLTGALRNKELQAEILIESISDGIILIDTEGKVNLINKAAAQMCEWPVEEALNFDARTVLRLLANEKGPDVIPDNEHPFSLVLKNRSSFNKTLILNGRSNKQTFISLSVSPVVNPKNDELIGTIAVFRDVSKEKTEEQQRAEFISTASHEMRTPVAAIEGYLALALNDKVSKIDTKAREYLEKAHASTQHLGKLFQDLLTSAKAEDGRLTSHPVVVEMGSFIDQLAEDLRFGAQKKGLEMELVHGSASGSTAGSTGSMNQTITPLYYVQVDPDRVREVITNVFDNAVKYTEQGKISLGITGNEKVVQIRVKDTGPGIPETDLPQLFQKFYRVDNTATRAIGGTGLGLFICRKIVELYNGIIWAESKVGEGSTFYINLPRLTAQRADQLQTAEKAKATLQ
jgi:signal transduction histidine kinase